MDFLLVEETNELLEEEEDGSREDFLRARTNPALMVEEENFVGFLSVNAWFMDPSLESWCEAQEKPLILRLRPWSRWWHVLLCDVDSWRRWWSGVPWIWETSTPFLSEGVLEEEDSLLLCFILIIIFFAGDEVDDDEDRDVTCLCLLADFGSDDDDDVLFDECIWWSWGRLQDWSWQKCFSESEYLALKLQSCCSRRSWQQQQEEEAVFTAWQVHWPKSLECLEDSRLTGHEEEEGSRGRWWRSSTW